MAEAGSSKQELWAIPADDLRRKLAAVRADDDQKIRHIGVVGGPPPHRHDFEETFTLLESEIDFIFRGEKHAVLERRNRPRSGQCPASISQLLAVCSKNALHLLPAGPEKFFLELGVPVATRTASPPKPDEVGRAACVAKAIALAPKYRTELLEHA
jgi:hypothetical protein